MRFWDSSALVPLVVGQAGSPQADEWLAADAGIITWCLSEVEVASALRRLVREGSLGAEEAHAAEERADQLARACHAVVDIEATKRHARRLLRVHPLRAADALQLGAAIAWASGRAAVLVFHTLDRRLGAAAQLEGFRVIPAPGN